MSNKKIKNAQKNSCNRIQFKSKLEKTIYQTLVEKGYSPLYEPETILLWDSFIPQTPFYDRETDNPYKKRTEKETKKSFRRLVLKTDKIIGIRYTPDFYFKYKDLDVWIESKGFENDIFYIKKKLFRKYLDNKLEKEGIKSIFFEVYTKNQLLQALDIIKEYTTNEE